MKVYFEKTGYGLGNIMITAFVSPTNDGGGYYYNLEGKKRKFWWCNPEWSEVYDSKDLPKDLLYSFHHGVNNFEVPEDKADSWTPEDLIYTKVEREQCTAFCKVKKALPNVKSLDDFWKLYPDIKKSGFISGEIINKLFELVGIERTPVCNGEIGIAFYQDRMIFKAICDEHFAKNKPVKQEL